jgi:N-methylhydantoinase A/oxoprolinase/acetone carboxylase beta subunit
MRQTETMGGMAVTMVREATEWALGIDIGGTFTDIALFDRLSGRVHAEKVLTDYADLSEGVLRGVRTLLPVSSVAAQDIAVTVHGTTLATNALIERRGAPTALIVTQGFRDLLEMARESRYDIYDIELRVPAPLVPRRHVFEIVERIDVAGEVVTPLDETGLAPIVAQVRQAGLSSIAICLINAFRNPSHERAIAAAIHRLDPGLVVSLSTDVMPAIKEYERASTTTANAYVRPVVEAYLSRLRKQLAALGIANPPLIMSSDGGVMGCDTACLYPVRLVESGPAGGALAAAHLSGICGFQDVIAFDMGGTTAKICVIDGGEPERSSEFEVARVYRFAKGSGLPLKVPVLEMIEIGAGGGSIAAVNDIGLLQVGPQSAGSDPGPACYGAGGSRPTVTDADLHLGYLDPGYFLGGRMHLDAAKAAATIQDNIAANLGLSLERAAWGIHEVVNDAMARAAKVHCLERGKDPRDYTLVAYGGAGPVHAYRVAEALGIERIIYPIRAGIMSAFGFLVAPAAFEMLRAVVAPLAELDLAALNAMLEEMAAEGRRQLETAGIEAADCVVERQFALRFAGQSYGLDVPVPAGEIDAATLRAMIDLFLTRYGARYHHVNADVPIELEQLRVAVRGPTPKVTSPQIAPADGPAEVALRGHREVYMPELGGYATCPVYDRYRLGAGAKLSGPAIVEEHESTVVLGVAARGTIDDYGNLIVTLPGTALSEAAGAAQLWR